MIIHSANPDFPLSCTQVYKSPKHDYFYVRLPKNAGTFTVNILSNFGWKKIPYDKLPKNFATDFKKLVIVREPIQRYISGIAQDYFENDLINKSNNILDFDCAQDIEYLFERIVFTPHTGRQIDILDGFDTNTCVFFNVDENFSKNLFDYLYKNFDIYIPYTKYYSNLGRHTSSARPSKNHAVKKISQLLNEPAYLEQVKNYFKPDIDFYDMVLNQYVSS